MPIENNPQAVAGVIERVRDELGVLIPSNCLSWSAVKTEIVGEGTRSQLHHALRLAQVGNAYIALPGKLSQSAACAEDLARKIVRELVDDDVARPIWEGTELRSTADKAA